MEKILPHHDTKRHFQTFKSATNACLRVNDASLRPCRTPAPPTMSATAKRSSTAGHGHGHTLELYYIFYTPNRVSVPSSENACNAHAQLLSCACVGHSLRCICGAKHESKRIAMHRVTDPTCPACPWARIATQHSTLHTQTPIASL